MSHTAIKNTGQIQACLTCGRLFSVGKRLVWPLCSDVCTRVYEARQNGGKFIESKNF